ncbi:hypothetical protein Tsubulata_047614 [Turnera subulata]|uniref:COBRA-like protein n=1 Tax=Turnera subulata TaxID=218843 RepID=A0A9Q0FJU1_9ROSI|nr:hypothetical protein Tsubulata_047614 [Turnera subulata]
MFLPISYSCCPCSDMFPSRSVSTCSFLVLQLCFYIHSAIVCFFFLFVLLNCIIRTVAEAHDHLDPNGNITIKWDLISWTPDGYVAVVTISNFQKYRNIKKPGWTLGWTWARKEIIWAMMGAQTTEQGDCSKFKGNIPHSCKKNPTAVDLLPGTPYNQQIANCCKAGVLSSWGKDPSASVSAFQISVGIAGTTNRTVQLPRNFTFLGPGKGYRCGPAKIVRPTVFQSPDGRRKTQALSKCSNLICHIFLFPSAKSSRNLVCITYLYIICQKS